MQHMAYDASCYSPYWMGAREDVVLGDLCCESESRRVWFLGGFLLWVWVRDALNLSLSVATYLGTYLME